MSEQLTLAKSRKAFKLDVKEGDYFILVQPDKSYDFHIQAYRKVADKTPVNDDYNRVTIGILRHTNPALNLITTAQKKTVDEVEIARNISIENIVSSAPDRQKQMQKAQADRIAEDHAERIKIKNDQIDDIRKATGQKTVAEKQKEESALQAAAEKAAAEKAAAEKAAAEKAAAEKAAAESKNNSNKN